MKLNITRTKFCVIKFLNLNNHVLLYKQTKLINSSLLF